MASPSPFNHLTIRRLSDPQPESPLVVFVHGFLGASSDWIAVADGLGGRYELVGLNLPGHGGCAGPEVGFEASATLLSEEIRRVAEGRRTFVVGYSMGGRFALYLLLRWPQLLSGGVVESAAPGLVDAHARISRAAHDAALANELQACANEGHFAEFLRGWYTGGVFDSLSVDQREALVRERLANDPAALAMVLRQYSVGLQPDLWAELEGLECPTLVICGERDHKYCQIAEEMAARSPRVAVQVVGNCGHNVHFEQPDAYTKVLRGFLDGVV